MPLIRLHFSYYENLSPNKNPDLVFFQEEDLDNNFDSIHSFSDASQKLFTESRFSDVNNSPDSEYNETLDDDNFDPFMYKNHLYY